MKKIFMFVNVDWFFLSHRLPIAEAALSKGVDMTVFADFTRSHEKQNERSFSFLQSPIRRGNNSFYDIFIEFIKTFKLIKRERPELIHAVTIKPILILGLIAFVLKIPFIASISGLGPAFKPSTNIEKLRLSIIMFIYKVIFSPDEAKIICQSNHDASILVSNGLTDRKKIMIIEGSGVDLNQFSNNENIGFKPIKVLMASRLIADKGIKEFCDAANIIKTKYKFDVHFLLAGDIDMASPSSLTYKEVSELSKSKNIEFLGKKSDIHKLMADIHIFVLPSYYAEGIPKVLLEAAACGCAVITTDHPGCRDAIIPGKTGLLVEPKDPASIVKSLKYLLEDHMLIKSMGQAGRKMAEERFSITKVVDNHFYLYHNQNKK